MSNELTPEQQALFNSIMGNSSQVRNLNPVIPVPSVDSLSNDQQDLYNSIMGNSSQMQNLNPMTQAAPMAAAQTAQASAVTPAPAAPAPAFGAAPMGGGDSGKKLSQSEIDALIASLTG
ncbi:MAG: hypothetical protein K6G83_16340 [Lachnospiraceae bacterium]|nr:hypothetical protein [Lachnospiraceae bacterium]